MWRETGTEATRSRAYWHFNPLPPCGGRPGKPIAYAGKHDFNPLPPCGGRPSSTRRRDTIWGISIHSLRVEGDNGRQKAETYKSISIHSLRVEGDWQALCKPCHDKNFNPLPPCGGRPDHPGRVRHRQNFNPLPPCGGRPVDII